MTGNALLKRIYSDHADKIFQSLYETEEISSAKKRYETLIAGMLDFQPPQAGFPQKLLDANADLRVFTAPGRTELGGNHTDHNLGKVLAASIQLDTAAVAAKRNDKIVFFRSAGYPDTIVNLDDLSANPKEKETTASLIRGIAHEFEKKGVKIGGWIANASSNVLSGSGLSSSASVEMLFAKIFDSFYGENKCNALEIAQMGQKAENEYFGKPSGLLDQIACAVGGAVAIDFADSSNPNITPIPFEPKDFGFALCIVNTNSSHADLTPAYAAIPNEMHAIAAFFHKKNLRSISLETLLEKIPDLRAAAGDRAVLRAIHFFHENMRVERMLETLTRIASTDKQRKDPRLFDEYLQLVNQSGDSSWELLQNISANQNPREQALALALALTKNFIAEHKKNGACRVHGGGFAGTIQAYIPCEYLEQYAEKVRAVFGQNAVVFLKVRPAGCLEILFSED